MALRRRQPEDNALVPLAAPGAKRDDWRALAKTAERELDQHRPARPPAGTGRWCCLLIDVSASMLRENRIRAARAGTDAYARTAVDAGYAIAIVTFGKDARCYGEFSTDINTTRRAIRRIDVDDDAWTDMQAGLERCGQILTGRLGDRRIAVVSDGNPYVPHGPARPASSHGDVAVVVTRGPHVIAQNRAAAARAAAGYIHAGHTLTVYALDTHLECVAASIGDIRGLEHALATLTPGGRRVNSEAVASTGADTVILAADGHTRTINYRGEYDTGVVVATAARLRGDGIHIHTVGLAEADRTFLADISTPDNPPLMTTKPAQLPAAMRELAALLPPAPNLTRHWIPTR